MSSRNLGKCDNSRSFCLTTPAKLISAFRIVMYYREKPEKLKRENWGSMELKVAITGEIPL